MSGAPPRRSGTVVWVDLATTDVASATRFYEQLLGWRVEDTEAPNGRYAVARVAAGEVGGMMARADDEAAAGVPPTWTVVVGVDDLEATLLRATDLGGSVYQAPLAIGGGARIAVIADPAGAVLALLEAPAAETGMAWGEPGGVVWVECLSRQPDSARSFYEELFGWTGEEGSGGYVVFSLDGERVGGLMPMPAAVPAGAPSHWLVHFGADVEDACARAGELGGQVLQPSHEISEGRFAVLAEPSGAIFAVFEGPHP